MGWWDHIKKACHKWIRRFALLASEEEEEEEEGGERSSSDEIAMFNFTQKNSPTALFYDSRNWKDKLKPNEKQTTILIMMIFIMVVVIIMSEFRIGRLILYPFAIISTVFHEFGHALVAWLTGGKMGSIEISMDESGATRFQGGWPCAILPAGYIGSTLIGALLLFVTFGARASRLTAIGVMVILAITLLFAHSFFTIISSIGLLALLVGAYFYKDGIFTRHFILLLGVCASLQSILSILNTTVLNTIKGSDAYVFAQRCSILIPAFVYGFLWFIISLVIQGMAIGSALILFKK